MRKGGETGFRAGIASLLLVKQPAIAGRQRAVYGIPTILGGMQPAAVVS